MDGRICGLLHHSAGGTGCTRVYRVMLDDGQEACLKAVVGPEARKRLENERQALAAVAGCPGYPQVKWMGMVKSPYDDFLWEGAFGLCITRMPGITVADILQILGCRGLRAPEAAVIHVARNALHTLSVLHGAGWLHRDPNPANILVDARGRVSIIDLGMAAPISELDAGFGTDQGVRNGYEPPESRSDDYPWGRYSDIYTVAAVAAQARFGTNDALRLPDGPFARWARWCLDLNPTARPPSCVEAIALLPPTLPPAILDGFRMIGGGNPQAAI